jgi:hypothetical protein
MPTMTEIILAALAGGVGGLAGTFLVNRTRKGRIKTVAFPAAGPPVCEHDWREDPEGWKDDQPWIVRNTIGGPEPDIIRHQSLTLVCSKCMAHDKKWRKVADVQEWPAVGAKP